MLPILWPGEPFIPAPPGQGLIFLWLEPGPVQPPPNAMGLIFLWLTDPQPAPPAPVSVAMGGLIHLWQGAP